MRGKVVLDTNVFIDYLRAGLHRDLVAGRIEGTVRFLSAVVLLELMTGADTPSRRRAVDRIREAFPDRRIVAPTVEAFERAGPMFQRVHGERGGALGGDRLGAMNDILIALSTWQIGATLMTSNARDFGRIAEHLPGFDWAVPP